MSLSVVRWGSVLRNARKPWRSGHLHWLVPWCSGRAKTATLVLQPIREYATRGSSGSDKLGHDLSSSDGTSGEDRETQTSDGPKDVPQADMSNEYSIDRLLETIRRRKSGEKEEEDIVSSKRSAPKTRSYAMDIDELVHFLREENALDLCVIRLGPERNYVGYFVTCTGTSTRHIRRIADNLVSELKYYFLNKGERVFVEGRDSEDWMAVNIGSAVVHVMIPEVRERYELEKLWSLGEDYDDQIREARKREEMLS